MLRFLIETGAGGDVSEGSVAIVVIEGIPAGVAEEQIGMAVVVVVGGRDAEAEAEIFSVEAGLRGDVFKCAVAPVAQQAIHELRRSLLEVRAAWRHW